MHNNKQVVLDILNSLEVIESNGGEDAYILVENNEENRLLLNEVGITDDTINGYGDEETLCILALAFGEKYANWYDKENGGLLYVEEFLSFENNLANKIILKCSQWKLEEIEREGGYSVVRDKGYTQLEPNTLTCVNYGIRTTESLPDWIRELKLYN